MPMHGTPDDPHGLLGTTSPGAMLAPSIASTAPAAQDAAASFMQAQAQGKVIPRDEPNPSEAVRKNVEEWQKRIRAAKNFWDKDFKRMRKDMEFAKIGADGEWKKGENYTANILQRHINQKVANLYAKDPKVVAKRRDRLEFSAWDGTPEMMQVAQMMLTMDPTHEESVAVVADLMQGAQKKRMFERMGRTLELLMQYYMQEGTITFKRRAKRAVRRALVTGIAWCEIGFQRLMEKQPDPDAAQALDDASQRLAALQSMAADVADGITEDQSAEMERMRNMIEQLQSAQFVVSREGPVWTWPRPTQIILDPCTREIEGFVGTGWIVKEWSLTPKSIQEVWGKDVSKGTPQTGGDADQGAKAVVNTDDGNRQNTGEEDRGKQGRRNVWLVWDKRTGTEFVLCEGWPDYIKAPDQPAVFVEGFFPLESLQFNPVEDDQLEAENTRVYGLSEIELLRDMQEEYNRARQGLREQRHANRPGYVARRGVLEDEDKDALATHPANAVIELNSLLPGDKIENLIQALPKIGIDPNLYDPTPQFEDIQRTGGSQEANLGGTAGDTATEASIAEGSRQTASQSNVDDLDDFLTSIARKSGTVLFLNMTREMVTKIVGPGSVWPEFSAQEAAEEIYLEVEAGSSGRPNKAMELANFERVVPFLMQVPGVRPDWLVKELIKRLDDSISMEDAYLSGLPAIAAMNSAQGVGIPGSQATTGDGRSNPNRAGRGGGNNAPNPEARPRGPQPATPAPTGGPGPGIPAPGVG